MERIERKVAHDPASGCWDWTGARFVGGYAAMRLYGRKYKVAQIMAWLHHGHTPGGMDVVCHRCNNKSCVNPAHLYFAPNSINTSHAHRDGLIPRFKAWRFKAWMAQKNLHVYHRRIP